MDTVFAVLIVPASRRKPGRGVSRFYPRYKTAFKVPRMMRFESEADAIAWVRANIDALQRHRFIPIKVED